MNRSPKPWQRIDDALTEALREIEIAVEEPSDASSDRRKLGASLGQAHHAIVRARRELAAHRSNEEQRIDRNFARDDLHDLLLRYRGDTPRVMIAVLPLPFVGNRVDLTGRDPRTHHDDFRVLLSRFNADERRRFHPYLDIRFGTHASRLESDHFHFWVAPPHEDAATESGDLYASGAFVFTRNMVSLESPFEFDERFINEQIEGTIRFATWLYAELSVAPHAIELQVAVANVPHWNYRTKNQLFRARGLDQYSIAPPQPTILPFPPDEQRLQTAQAEVDITFRLQFLRPMAR